MAHPDRSGRECEGDYGHTALIEAARKNATDIVKLLIEKGADLDAKDSIGDTALMQTARWNYEETARLLIEAGADLNAKNKYGDTALMIGGI